MTWSDFRGQRSRSQRVIKVGFRSTFSSFYSVILCTGTDACSQNVSVPVWWLLLERNGALRAWVTRDQRETACCRGSSAPENEQFVVLHSRYFDVELGSCVSIRFWYSGCYRDLMMLLSDSCVSGCPSIPFIHPDSQSCRGLIYFNVGPQ